MVATFSRIAADAAVVEVERYYNQVELEADIARAASYYQGEGAVSVAPGLDARWQDLLDIHPGAAPDRAGMLRFLSAETAAGEPTLPDQVKYLAYDLTFSASKEVSVQWAAEPNAACRAIYEAAHRGAVRDTMEEVSKRLGWTRRGAGSAEEVAGEIAWVSCQHYTSRPEGSGAAADPNIHSHVLIRNAVLTADGHIGAIDSMRLNGAVKELGAIYHMRVAARLADAGIAVDLDRTGIAAAVADTPAEAVDLFSKRDAQVTASARAYAEGQGLDWDALSAAERAGFARAAAAVSRAGKNDGKITFEDWREELAAAGIEIANLIGRTAAPDRSPEARAARAVQAWDSAARAIGEAFEKESVLDETVLRTHAARALIPLGGGTLEDVGAVLDQVERRGVIVHGEVTRLIRGPENDRVRYTTQAQLDAETGIVEMGRAAAADRTGALTREELDAAITKTVAAKGRELNPGQLDMAVALSTRGRLALGIGVAGAGKAQPLDAAVLTPKGFRPIGELAVGDVITAPDGSRVPVTGVFPQGEKSIYRVVFEDGRTVECCDDHLWKVWTNTSRYVRGSGAKASKKREFSWRTKSLKEIRGWFERSRSRVNRTAVPLVAASAIELPHQQVPIPPYTMGALLGDGHFTSSVQFSTADSEILDRVLAELPAYEACHLGKYDYRLSLKTREGLLTGRRRRVHEETAKCLPKVGGRGERLITYAGETQTLARWASSRGLSKGLLSDRFCRQGWTAACALGFEPPPKQHRAFSPLQVALRTLGLEGTRSHEKFIPDAYKCGTVPQRVALLQGLLDTDGSVEGVRGTHASFTSTSERLARDVQWIAWSLGAVAKIAPRQTFCISGDGTQKAGLPSWRVSIVHPDLKSLFWVPRKASCCNPTRSAQRLCITAIEPVGVKAAVCIAVDHPEHLYVTDGFVVTHNTTLLAPVVAAYQNPARPGGACRVFGIATAWRQAGALRGAGITDAEPGSLDATEAALSRPAGGAKGKPGRRRDGDEDLTAARALRDQGIEGQNIFATAALLAAYEKGRLAIDALSVVVIDEVSQLGVRDAYRLLDMQAATGCRILAIGDDKQCQAVEAGDVIDLFRRALPEGVPELLETVRQLTDAQKEIAGLFRDGKPESVEKALRLKAADGALEVVPGGTDAVYEAAGRVWARMADEAAEKGWEFGLSAPTHQHARAASAVIRGIRRERGEITGPDRTVECVDRRGAKGEQYDLQLAVGDRVRLFTKVGGQVLDDGGRRRRGRPVRVGDNGDVVRIAGFTERGFAVEKDGRRVEITWQSLRDKDTGRVKLSAGEVHTIDASQGATGHLWCNLMPEGAAIGMRRAYVSESRQRVRTYTVVGEDAERQAIARERGFGSRAEITADDVLKHMAKALARMTEKTSALRFSEAIAALRGPAQDMAAEEKRRAQLEHARLIDRTAAWNRQRQARPAPAAVVRLAERLRERAFVRVMGPPLRRLAAGATETTAAMRATYARLLDATRLREGPEVAAAHVRAAAAHTHLGIGTAPARPRPTPHGPTLNATPRRSPSH